MIAGCLRAGLDVSRRHAALVVAVWLVSLVLALPVTVEFHAWWGRAFDYAPRGDDLLAGPNLATLTDLSHYDRSSVWNVLAAGVGVAMLLALVANPFLAGGILGTILGRGDDRPVMRRFCDGGVLFFWRFLKLLVLSAAGVLVGVAGCLALVRLLTAPVADSLSEPWTVAIGALPLVVVGLFLVLGALVLDYARIAVAIEDVPGVAVAWRTAVINVVRHPVATFGIAAAIALPYLLALACYLAFRLGTLPVSWPLILIGLFVQQGLLIGRAVLRVVQWGAEVDLSRRVLRLERSESAP